MSKLPISLFLEFSWVCSSELHIDHMKVRLAVFLVIATGLGSPICAETQVRPKYTTLGYQFVKGKTAHVDNRGVAHAPANAPKAVKKLIEAGNAISKLPYRRGGGRVAGIDRSGYDCSGATYYLLREAGLIRSPLVSKGYMRYGESGYGKWINVYAKDGHVFLVVAGLRFDTGGCGQRTGPRWKAHSRNVNVFVVRHPKGH